MQYLVRTFQADNPVAIEQALNDIGLDGWRLLAVDRGNFIFAREGGERNMYMAQGYQPMGVPMAPIGAAMTGQMEPPVGPIGLPPGITLSNRQRMGGLTNRELDVVELLATGHPNRRIAEILNLKDQSIKNIVSSAMRKLQVDNRTQLALKYFEIAPSLNRG